MRGGLVADGCDAGPHSIAAILADHMPSPPAVTTIRRILTAPGRSPPTAQAAQALLHPVPGRPAQRMLAGRLHPLDAGRRHRRRDPALARRPLPVPAVRHRPHPRHRSIVVATFRTACTPRHAGVHPDRQRSGLHHPLHRRRPQRLRDELRDRRHPEERPPNHPQTQGKVERFHQTLKKWLGARARSPATHRRAAALLDEFVDEYNHRARTDPCTGAPPRQAYTARPKATPEHNSPATTASATTSRPRRRVTLRRAGRMHHIGSAPNLRPHRRHRCSSTTCTSPSSTSTPARSCENSTSTHQRQPAPRRQTRSQTRQQKRRHAQGLQVPDIKKSRDIR